MNFIEKLIPALVFCGFAAVVLGTLCLIILFVLSILDPHDQGPL